MKTKMHNRETLAPGLHFNFVCFLNLDMQKDFYFALSFFKLGVKVYHFLHLCFPPLLLNKYWVEEELLSGLVHDVSRTLKKMLSHLFLANENFSIR